MIQPELHRPLPFDRVGPNGLDIAITATPAECAALAQRMNLPAIKHLTCSFHLTQLGLRRVQARGQLKAEVTQTCVVTLEDFDATVEETFAIRFVPEDEIKEELDLEDDDEVPFDNGVVDLGEAAAEQLGLALDPYPRMPGAELPALDEEEEDNPFEALNRLRRMN
ncbi:MAG TPA: DUF177 domain-containing protein [Rhodopila sp.]|uniref:YceD family protein n=1 Tax=Rhodopila sp. TaxID=2480087 RepID=UPI002C522CA6|nr:DUF177 domain-containing protein [Rhodopila sp.]HVY15628.1 DUF177 domain-containing protein [Rhodopila sp.]